MNDLDIDQIEDSPEELDDLSRRIFDAGVKSTLRAILAALDSGAARSDIRLLCESALIQFEKKETTTNASLQR